MIIALAVAGGDCAGRFEQALNEFIEAGVFAGYMVSGGGTGLGDRQLHLWHNGQQLHAGGGGDFGDLAVERTGRVEERDVAAPSGRRSISRSIAGFSFAG